MRLLRQGRLFYYPLLYTLFAHPNGAKGHQISAFKKQIYA